MNTWIAVFLGGGLGSVTRFGITRALLAFGPKSAFPWATFVSNAVASAVLAWLILRMQPQLDGRDALKAFLAVGFCGGFSTFSTFSYENFLLLREGQTLLAVGNVAFSLTVCLAAFYLVGRNV